MLRSTCEDPHRVVILGAGEGGTAMLRMLLDIDIVQVCAIADHNHQAPGLDLARKHGIPVYDNVQQAIAEHVPCVAFNLTRNEMVEAVAVDLLGAGGVIGGREADLIWQVISRLIDAKAELRFQASRDQLTNLYNRRYMLEQLHHHIAQAQRYKHSFSLVLLDLDHFKKINDTHGHAAGDLVLKNVAEKLRENMRESDVLGRWGGEEFLILLPQTSMEGALEAGKKWLARIRLDSLKLEDGSRIVTTFSAGVATFDASRDGSSVTDLAKSLLSEADAALYAAKGAGRRQIQAFDPTRGGKAYATQVVQD